MLFRSLFAYGILRMDGIDGKKGWQWLFISAFQSVRFCDPELTFAIPVIVEGVIALGCAILFLLFLPKSPVNPTPLLFPRLHFFDERQRHIMQSRVLLDDEAKTDTARPLTAREILSTLANPRVWPQ